jgi:hypothetical protein
MSTVPPPPGGSGRFGARPPEPRIGRPAGHAFSLRTFKTRNRPAQPNPGEVCLRQLARDIDAGFAYFFQRRPGLRTPRPEFNPSATRS